MGEVWVAQHRMLARPAAIKLIKLKDDAIGSRRREDILGWFEREAQATARLRSLHTVELYDFGRAAAPAGVTMRVASTKSSICVYWLA